MGLEVPASTSHGESTVYRLIRHPHINKLTSTHTHLKIHTCKHTLHTHNQHVEAAHRQAHVHNHLFTIFLSKKGGLSHLFLSASRADEGEGALPQHSDSQSAAITIGNPPLRVQNEARDTYSYLKLLKVEYMIRWNNLYSRQFCYKQLFFHFIFKHTWCVRWPGRVKKTFKCIPYYFKPRLSVLPLIPLTVLNYFTILYDEKISENNPTHCKQMGMIGWMSRSAVEHQLPFMVISEIFRWL